ACGGGRGGGGGPTAVSVATAVGEAGDTVAGTAVGDGVVGGCEQAVKNREAARQTANNLNIVFITFPQLSKRPEKTCRFL
ncbi:MAG: hypothetical protein ACE5FD_06635, partial [Anaerolineae bacterium]